MSRGASRSGYLPCFAPFARRIGPRNRSEPKASRAALIALAIALVGTAANAGWEQFSAADSPHYYTAQQLLEGGKPGMLAFVAGVHDADATHPGVAGNSDKLCVPAGVPIEALTEVAWKYMMDSSPQLRRIPAAIAVRLSLQNAWPCTPPAR